MSFLGNLFGKRATSGVARDRLQILLAHERAIGGGDSDLIAKLHREILEVIKRHMSIDNDKVTVKLDGSGKGCSVLEIDIEVPTPEQTAEMRRLA
ncbi:cell division topological specificity factor MinE [Brytella acorum]|uniref:Cell division topological specificity factor n=1 Tax=Brytella acorum TaxID=2959299 RepID=A0AA35Y478_9PROT|nr:cell division topological specificity factor MinE [Brytella acorum]MDF3624008.1 cell division topological specificity factor MinE [Brytella acorum]CAI9120889.1 cell division topological specificity factor MinE [Brytella acorum]